MSAVKTLALCTIVWSVVLGPAQADPITGIRGNGPRGPRGGGRSPTIFRRGPRHRARLPPTPSSRRSKHDHDVPTTSTMPIASLSPSAGSPGPMPSWTWEPPLRRRGVLTQGGAQPWYPSPVVEERLRGPAHRRSAGRILAAGARASRAYVQVERAVTGIDPRPLGTVLAHAQRRLEYLLRRESRAIGISDVGGNGFSFIDKLDGVKTVDELSWAVAHNVAHELLHAWGVGDHPDTSGAYLDSATASWSLLTDPNATFSPAAIQTFLEGDSQLAERYASGWPPR